MPFYRLLDEHLHGRLSTETGSLERSGDGMTSHTQRQRTAIGNYKCLYVINNNNNNNNNNNEFISDKIP